MGVSPEQVAARMRKEERERASAAAARAARLLEKLPLATELLRAAGATRVWLFGSLASEAPAIESDVDLAVDRLEPARYFELLSALMELFGTRVDLVVMSQAPASLRERIETTGRAL